MDCPACDTPMIEEIHHGVTVDRCQSCQGFWFDIEEIQRYLNARGTRSGHPVPKDEEMIERESGEPKECTCCEQVALRQGLLRGIAYHRCSWCGGVFLPGSQLKKIQGDPTDVLKSPRPTPADPIGLGIDFVEFVTLLFVGIFTGFE